MPRPDAEQALLEAPPRARRWIAPAVGASLALHGAAIAALVWFVADEASPPRPDLMPVEIIAVAAPEPAAEPGAAESAVNSPNVETGETSESPSDTEDSSGATEPDLPSASLEPTHATMSPRQPLATPAPEGPTEAATGIPSSEPTPEAEPAPPLPVTDMASLPRTEDQAAPIPTAPRPKPRSATPDRIPVAPPSRSEPSARRPEPPALQPADEASPDGNTVTAAAAAERRTDESVGISGKPLTAPPRFTGKGLANPAPRYPYMARRLGQEGRVILRVAVSAAGKAETVSISRSSGFRLLDHAALKAVRRWRFLPAQDGDRPVRGALDVPVSFRLTQ